MKFKNVLSLSLILLILSACEKETKQLNQQKELAVERKKITHDEVTAVTDKWLNLWATYDLSLLNKIFYQSEDLTYFSSEKVGLIKGYSKLLPHHVGFGFVEGGKEPPVDLWLEEIETRINGETALVAATWYNGDKMAPGDSVQHGPVTFVLLRDEEGAVKIAHAHFANN